MRREYGYSAVLLILSGLTGLLAVYLGGRIAEWPWFYSSMPFVAAVLSAVSFLLGLDRSPAAWIIPLMLFAATGFFTLFLTLAGMARVVTLQGMSWHPYASALLVSSGVMGLLSLASASAWVAGYLLSPFLRYEERPRTIIYYVKAERVERLVGGRLSGAAAWLSEKLEELAEAVGDLVWRLLGY